MTRARKSIGYCPQFDALSDSLTGREHLVLICKLRGIPPKVIKPTVDKALSRLELDAHADKPVYSYSGGNMRRLSTAIALIADPPVLLLVGVVKLINYCILFLECYCRMNPRQGLIQEHVSFYGRLLKVLLVQDMLCY